MPSVVKNTKKFPTMRLLRKCGTNLDVIYEGTDKVKEIIVNLFIYEYELFQIKEGETIENMFAYLSKIIGALKATVEHITRILRSLPPQWHSKVIALESMDLKSLTYDEV